MSFLFPEVTAIEDALHDNLLRLQPVCSSYFVPPLLDKPQDPIIDTLRVKHTVKESPPTQIEPNHRDTASKATPLELLTGEADTLDSPKILADDLWEAATKRKNNEKGQVRSWDNLRKSYHVPISTTGFLFEQDSIVFAAVRHHLQPQLQENNTELQYVFEDVLLRSLKRTALGASTSMYEWESVSESFITRSSGEGNETTFIIFGKDETISNSIISVFLTIGTALRRLEQLVLELRERTTRTTPTHHAFAHALTTCLSYIRRLLEDCSPREFEALIGDDLCTVMAQYQPAQEILLALLAFCNRDLNVSPSEYKALPTFPHLFLSLLFDFLDRHLERKSPHTVCAMFAFVLTEASRHYIDAVCLMVGFNGYGNRSEDGVSEISNDFPTFFSSDLVNALPTARRSLKLLQAAYPDHFILREKRPTPVCWFWTEADILKAFSNSLSPRLQERSSFQEAHSDLSVSVHYKPELAHFRTFDLEPGSGVGSSCFNRNYATAAEARLRNFVDTFPETLPAVTPMLSHLSDLMLRPLLSHCSALSSTLLSIFLSLPPPLDLQAHLKLMKSYMLLTSPSFKARLSAALFSDSLEFTVSEQSRQIFSLGSHRRASRRSETIKDKVWAVGLAPALLERDIWPPIGADLSFFLRRVIFDSFDAGDGGEDVRQKAVEEVESRLGFAIRGSEGNEDWSDPLVVGALDFLYMEYKPPPPLDVVITPDIIFKYQRLFALLLRVLRVENATAAVFRMTRNPATPLFQTLVGSRKLLMHFRFISQQFVSSLSGYIYDTAISGNYGPFLNKLRPDEQAPFPDVFSLAEAHSDMMDDILAACLMRTSQRVAGSHLRECLNIILKFAIVVGELHRGRLKEYEASVVMEDLFNRFRKRMTSLVKALRTMLEKSMDPSTLAGASWTGSLVQGPVGGTEALFHLLTHLDFGDWWSKLK
ncbi:hypothetical protein L218DRAFT_969958 [Marasmius fiardii PR-910]|nr:hypothetical protein L218DRAFT_969958 [Marasmius fiardii PR-910]